MQSARWVLVALAAIFVIAAPGAAPAQQADPYVSCVRCHALPTPQAEGQMGMHGSGVPPWPEMACGYCHGTHDHEQNPDVPPLQRYFLVSPPGTGSYLTGACTGCHASYVPGTNHPNDLIPYDTAVLPTAVPPSVLPLFDPFGSANQVPFIGGVVCSTCHDPHEPSYDVDGRPKFLRVGSWNDIAPLCGTCHAAEATPPTFGADLVLPGRSNSVRFAVLPDGALQIDVTVKNRGNAPSAAGAVQIFWADESGYPVAQIGNLPLPPLAAEEETTIPFWWLPPPGPAPDAGFFLISLPNSDLLPGAIREYVRAMYLPPAPTDLRVNWVGSVTVDLGWNPPPGGPFEFDVYRDGMPLARTAIPVYTDNGVAAETPHVYTVKTVTAGGIASESSNPVGATTLPGAVLRVPEDYPTIQAAILAAAPGTSIHVAPGTYTEAFSFSGMEGITVRGQDANAAILDYSGSPTTIDLGPPPYPSFPYASGNTLAGFTIRGDVEVFLHFGDVLAESVLQDTPAVVAAGGLAAQCVFDTWMPIEIPPGGFFAAANSIFSSGMPLIHAGPPSSSALLLNNNFTFWPQYIEYQGSGNFGGYPTFEEPGPPQRYFTTQSSVTTDRGLPFWAPFGGGVPDVGAFEVGRPYTPQPPGDLTATFEPGGPGYPGSVRLDWMASIDPPGRVQYYHVYRATDPSFPSGSGSTLYASLPAWPGPMTYLDPNVTPATTYYYQVRADAGPTVPPATGVLLSAPTNTASATVVANRPPLAVDDAAQTPEDLPVHIAVLANDTDPDGDLLFIDSVSQPGHGSTGVNPDGTIAYLPAADYAGADQFTYTVSDGRGEYAVALVTVDVAPVNDAPVADPQSVTTAEDTTLPLVLTATDPEGNPMTFWVQDSPTHGRIVGGANLSYVPDENYSGPDSFTFTAQDGALHSAPATVTITVSPVNDPPVANAGPDQSGIVGQALTFSGAASSDGDGTIAGYSWDWGDGTAGGSGVGATHAFPAAGTFTVTLTVTDSDGATATDTGVVTIAAVNLALSKPAFSSTARSGYLAANAVDGSGATSWRSSKTSGTQWLYVDLGSGQGVSTVKVFWEGDAFAKAFKIETSTDQKKWTPCYSTSAGGGGVSSITLATPVAARYVRVSCTKANNTSYYGVTEFEIYQ